MNIYQTNGCRPVAAESLRKAGETFALLMARRRYGRRGAVGAFRVECWAESGDWAECAAFIGAPARGERNALSGGNVRFAVYLNA